MGRGPRWTYEVAKRQRHGKMLWLLIRNDNKVIAEVSSYPLLAKIKAKFDQWARQPWS